MLDQTFLHFYLIQPLVNWWGGWLAIKIYPLIFFLVFGLASFLVFWRLSRSWLISLGLGLSVVLSASVYYPLLSGGVVLSALSEFAFSVWE